MSRLNQALAYAARRPALMLLVLAAVALSAALAQPFVTLQRPAFRYVIVLDITQSMNTQDRYLAGQPVSRLELAKRAVLEALQELPCGSEAGLAIFTEYRSFLLFAPVEVCAHQEDIARTLSRMDWRMAWAGNSEITKGLHSAARMVRELSRKTSLVFLTDGHEAPPIHPAYLPRFPGEPGEIAGLVVGVGGTTPVPIPKRDMDGRFLGYWGADEVKQIDAYSAGRSGSVAGEGMVDTAPAPSVPRAEHLTSLREPHLQRLAQESGLRYLRLTEPKALAIAMRNPELAERAPAAVALSWPLALAALVCLVAAGAWPGRKGKA
jgi:mxaL protein